MANIQSLDGAMRWEQPHKTTDTVLPAAVDFISGDFPPVMAFPMVVEVGATITVGMVLEDNGSGALQPAVFGSGNPVLGVAMSGVTTAAANRSVLLARTGVFDPARLTWDVSFDTDAKKLGAFEAAPSPTQVILRKRVPSAP